MFIVHIKLHYDYGPYCFYGYYGCFYGTGSPDLFFFGHFVLREEFMKKRKFLQYELISKCTGVVINSKLTKVNTTNK